MEKIIFASSFFQYLTQKRNIINTDNIVCMEKKISIRRIETPADLRNCNLTDESREELETMVEHSAQVLFVEEPADLLERWANEYKEEMTAEFGAATAEKLAAVWKMGGDYALRHNPPRENTADEILNTFSDELQSKGMDKEIADLNAHVFVDGINYVDEQLNGKPIQQIR